jgi:putative endonuclease
LTVLHLLTILTPQFPSTLHALTLPQRYRVKRQYYVYIMASESGTLYTGVTNNLERRVYEHKNRLFPGFTDKYNITRLVYFEETSDIYSAIVREKQIKGWLRAKKVALIESINPKWKDLSADWYEKRDSSRSLS